MKAAVDGHPGNEAYGKYKHHRAVDLSLGAAEKICIPAQMRTRARKAQMAVKEGGLFMVYGKLSYAVAGKGECRRRRGYQGRRPVVAHPPRGSKHATICRVGVWKSGPPQIKTACWDSAEEVCVNNARPDTPAHAVDLLSRPADGNCPLRPDYAFIGRRHRHLLPVIVRADPDDRVENRARTGCIVPAGVVVAERGCGGQRVYAVVVSAEAMNAVCGWGKAAAGSGHASGAVCGLGNASKRGAPKMHAPGEPYADGERPPRSLRRREVLVMGLRVAHAARRRGRNSAEEVRSAKVGAVASVGFDSRVARRITRGQWEPLAMATHGVRRRRDAKWARQSYAWLEVVYA
ncbi:hypothetical protein C8J57DRAFT_1254903 [Mycena rebaudengoi]|nr:hypothetical protein C8J57DRAFT_1254903 [Mycena rebaudengoi]